ncbi:MAG TPA: type I restriction enzyme HsdR N-terminal domain-containing protein, partial [Azonexus sp.]|nr:type I restriction enzyme HsdR N-terminal domain-containing protein [Azonexus sp.]
MQDKKKLSERDICTQYINPALQRAGWDFATQVREEVTFTRGRVIVRGKLHTRGKHKRADYVLYQAPNLPIAVIEAKDNTHGIGDGMQQGLGYAETLEVPFAISSNGDGFLVHDRTGQRNPVELELALDAFPSPDELWQRYCAWKGIASAERRGTVETPYYDDGSGKSPRYYQINAINR